MGFERAQRQLLLSNAPVRTASTGKGVLSSIVFGVLTNAAGNICPRGGAMLFDSIVAPRINFDEINPLTHRQMAAMHEFLRHAQPLEVLA